MPLHTAHAIQSLESGAHVFSEVPAVMSVEEADALIAAVERSGRHYMMAENCCYWGFIDAARQFHARGDFGTVFYAEAEYIHDVRHLMHDAAGRPGWRYGRPPITYSTHSLGPLLWITGRYATETTCYGTAGNFDPALTDLQVAIFKLTGGAVARITVSFSNAHWGHHRYSLFGTRGSMDTGWVGKDEPRFQLPSLPNGTGKAEAGSATSAGPVKLPLNVNMPGAPAAATAGGHGTAEWFMYRAFLRALAEGTRPPIDVYDSVMYSLPGMCAAQSAATGKPVEIPQYQNRRRK